MGYELNNLSNLFGGPSDHGSISVFNNGALHQVRILNHQVDQFLFTHLPDLFCKFEFMVDWFAGTQEICCGNSQFLQKFFEFGMGQRVLVVIDPFVFNFFS